MATSPGAGRGTPSSSKKMTKNNPPLWWSMTNTRTARVSGRNQPGSRNQSGTMSARKTASASMDGASRLSACQRRQDLLSGTPVEHRAERSGEMLRIRSGRDRRADLLSGDGLHRRGALLGMTARDDAVEIGKVRREVEREAVTHRRPVQLDADGGQLLAS